MTRDELVALRETLLLGTPPYKKGAMGELLREKGAPGIHEYRQMGAYDAGAMGTLLALESALSLCQHVIDQMPREKDE